MSWRRFLIWHIKPCCFDDTLLSLLHAFAFAGTKKNTFRRLEEETETCDKTKIFIIVIRNKKKLDEQVFPPARDIAKQISHNLLPAYDPVKLFLDNLLRRVLSGQKQKCQAISIRHLTFYRHLRNSDKCEMLLSKWNNSWRAWNVSMNFESVYICESLCIDTEAIKLLIAFVFHRMISSSASNKSLSYWLFFI